MAELFIPKEKKHLKDASEIRSFLKDRGVFFDQWSAQVEFGPTADQDEILAAYEDSLKPFMESGGYQTADVISVNEKTENLPALREKFIKEHIHSEDEIRFFVEGEGYFWFNLEEKGLFCLRCQRGDLISVPAGSKHWFDMGEKPHVKAIRIFIDQSGWVPHYTDSGIDQEFQYQTAN